jgi:ribose-phosphate pyrophosphokinase
MEEEEKILYLDPDDVRFFSGRSNPELARKITDYLDVPLEKTKYSRFSNDNLFVQLEASVRGRNVYIVQSLTPPVSDHLLELLMMLDIAKSAAAREIHAIIPYFSYARSDKKDAPRISITARLVADLLKTAGATHVMAMRLHSAQVHGFFSIPADPVTARHLMAQYAREKGLNTPDTVVVAPDIGNAKSSSRLAEMLGLSVATAVKTRLSDQKVRIDDMLQRQVAGFRHAIFYDDEIATGGTVVELCRNLVESGVERITVMCTHGLFLGNAVEKLRSIPQIREVVTTDTVVRPPERRPDNLTVISTAPVFGGAIRQNYLRESIGDLFSFWEDTRSGLSPDID